jgi:hypothetical protein
LAERGLVFDIAQVAVESLGGALVFVIVALTLKMPELRSIFNLILRRQNTPTRIPAA